MQKIILIMMMSVISNTVLAEWTRVGVMVDDGNLFYVDLSTISAKGSIVKMWDLVDYKVIQDNRYLSMTRLSEYNCMEEQSRLITFILSSGNMGHGSIVSNSPAKEREWQPIRPESADKILFKIACEKQ